MANLWKVFFFFLNSSLPSSSFPCFFVLLLLPSGFAAVFLLVVALLPSAGAPRTVFSGAHGWCYFLLLLSALTVMKR